MRKDAASSEFAMVTATAIMVFASLLFLVCLPVVNAAQPAKVIRPGPHINEYVGSLDQEQRRLLQESITHSLYSSSSKGDKDRRPAVPDYQLYYSVFQQILLQPLLAAGLPERDRELIRGLPVHNDRQFVQLVQQSLTAVCNFIERSNAGSAAAVNLAASGFRQAQSALERELNRHYRTVVRQLSDTGQALVSSEIDRLRSEESLVYTEMDLETLGFTQPEFVFAFLQDSCVNAERILPELVTDQRTLQDQLEDDYRKGAVQLFPYQ